MGAGEGKRKRDLAVRLIAEWLKGEITGCGFARQIAKNEKLAQVSPRTVRYPPVDELGDELNAALLASAASHQAALFIVPSLRDDKDIAQFLSLLTRNPAFHLSKKPWPADSGRDDVLVRLAWQTPQNLRAYAMGLAPSGLMPLTRRAPFVCLMIWPGGHENPHRPANGRSTVSIADMKTSIKNFRGLWEATEEATRARAATEPTMTAAIRDVTFCLRRDVAEATLRL